MFANDVSTFRPIYLFWATLYTAYQYHFEQ